MISFRFLVIPLTLIAALMLMILPLPDWVRNYRPDWVALFLIYWSMALPKRVGLWYAFVSGFFVDVAMGTMFGQHSLTLVLITFINLNVHQRIRVMTLGRQAIYVLVLLLINQLIQIWIEGMMERDPPFIAFIGPALTGMALWPWVFILMRDIRRKAKLS